MLDFLLIVPKAGKTEDPFGTPEPLRCAENDSVMQLFVLARQRLAQEGIRLSVEAAAGDAVALRALSPESRDTLASIGLHSGSRIIVGFE